MSRCITVKDGVEVQHYEDGSVVIRSNTTGMRLTPSEKRALVNALTWERNTRPGQIGDEDGE